MKKDIIRNVNISLKYIEQLVGTPYSWYVSGQDIRTDRPPLWASNNKVPEIKYIRNESINCIGVINLMRRSVNLTIPGINISKMKYKYPGGPYIWTEYLERRNVLYTFDEDVYYPPGTLLIRKYKSGGVPGHVAVIYKTNTRNTLLSEIIHSYPYDIKPKADIKVEPGVKIEPLYISHHWFRKQYYTHICYPNHWLC